MIDDRIGSIGSTQGVNANPSPSRKNSGRIASRRPLCSEDSMRPRSDSGAGFGAASGPPLPLAASLASDSIGV